MTTNVRAPFAPLDAPASGSVEFLLAPDVRAWAPNPVGKYLVGPNWLHFCANSNLGGLFLWGCPSPKELRELLRSMERIVVTRQRAMLLLDLEELSGIDVAGIEFLNEHGRDICAAFLGGAGRLAMARPPGLIGAVAAAFFGLLGARADVSVFERLSDALSWLVRPPSPGLARAILQLRDEVQSHSPLIQRLRAEIARTRLQISMR